MAVPSSGGFSKRVAGILATAVPGRGGIRARCRNPCNGRSDKGGVVRARGRNPCNIPGRRGCGKCLWQKGEERFGDPTKS